MVTDDFTLSAINLTQMKMHGTEQTLRSFPGESCYLAVHPPAAHSAPLLWPRAPHPSTSLADNSKTLGNGLMILDEPGC